MEAGDRELVERAEGVEQRLWLALVGRLRWRERQLLHLWTGIQLQRLLVGGLLVPGPGYNAEEMRQELQENVEVAKTLLEEVGVGG